MGHSHPRYDCNPPSETTTTAAPIIQPLQQLCSTIDLDSYTAKFLPVSCKQGWYQLVHGLMDAFVSGITDWENWTPRFVGTRKLRGTPKRIDTWSWNIWYPVTCHGIVKVHLIGLVFSWHNGWKAWRACAFYWASVIHATFMAIPTVWWHGTFKLPWNCEMALCASNNG